jgi:uncharacterized SAM-binding protein YcdF (DUF218 family)
MDLIFQSLGHVRRRFKAAKEYCGPDGAITLLLSTVVIVITSGLSWLWLLTRVYRVARNTGCQPQSADYLLVLGKRLKRGTVSPEYAQRLDRATELLRRNSKAKVLLLGGKTDADACSEADAGRMYLVAQGICPTRIILEDRSRHTLENLKEARALLASENVKMPSLITSRYHLARSAAIAHGLGIRHQLCAAEIELRLDTPTLRRLFGESHHLHWYFVGRAWARWTRNEKMLRRIS